MSTRIHIVGGTHWPSDDKWSTEVVVLEDESLVSVKDAHGHPIFGFDVKEDGTVDVGFWPDGNEWSVMATLEAPQGTWSARSGGFPHR